MRDVPFTRTSISGQHRAGFTLVELLVVLGIIGLLATAMPAVIAAIEPGMRLKAAARGLADELRAIRATAILDHRETSLTLDLTSGEYQTDPGGGSRRLPPGIGLGFDGPRSSIDNERVAIRFYPDGTSTGGRIALSSGHSKHRVTAHWLSGRVAVDE